MKLVELARRLGLLPQPGDKIEAARKDIARRSQAEQFRDRRNRAFKGIVTQRTAMSLYAPIRLERAQERVEAGVMARMDQEARRQAERLRKGPPA